MGESGVRFGLVLAVTALATFAETSAAQRGTPPERRARRLDVRLADQPPPLSSKDGIPVPAARSAGLPAIVVTGYWPPSNEAVRRFSTSVTQNPGGWIGGNWEGRGYDVYSYFPEFSNTCTMCGKGVGDLTVDYQDTSIDFRPLVEQHAPVAVVTTSRGYDSLDWELEMNQFNRSVWIDDFCTPRQPTPEPPDSSVPSDFLRESLLPVQDIVDAVDAAAIGATPFVCWSGNGGGFLSEFIAYQGVWYQADHRSPTMEDWCVMAGHVHVGGMLSSDVAREAFEITLREVIAELDRELARTVCQPDVKQAGPGSARLRVCGHALATGETADLLIEGAPPSAFAAIVVGSSTATPLAWKGGLVMPYPPTITRSLSIDADGRGLIEGLRGGGGPFTAYTQVLYRDDTQPEGWGFTNTIAVDVLP